MGAVPSDPRKGVIKFTRARASRKSSLFGAGLAGVYVLGNFNEFIYRFKADPGENRSARLLPSFLSLSLFPHSSGLVLFIRGTDLEHGANCEDS